MGFPVSELKALETDPVQPEAPLTARTTFMGLYGVDSPLPTAYIDDITQQREGHEALEGFLDIFNHRFMTQFYRIWRKYPIRPPSSRAAQTTPLRACWG